MNMVALRGNLARDPELRKVGTGDKATSVVNFTVATSREFTRADGTIENLGTIQYWHKNPLKRLLCKI